MVSSLTPRTYANAPVGVNQLELDYTHATADDSIDTSLVIGGSHLEVNEVSVAYTRTFGIVDHLAWIKASVPFAYVSGSVAGSGLSRSVAGAGDASLQLTTLLLGGSALSVADFEKYQPTTTVGASLTVSGPSGQKGCGPTALPMKVVAALEKRTVAYSVERQYVRTD